MDIYSTFVRNDVRMKVKTDSLNTTDIIFKFYLMRCFYDSNFKTESLKTTVVTLPSLSALQNWKFENNGSNITKFVRYVVCMDVQTLSLNTMDCITTLVWYDLTMNVKT